MKKIMWTVLALGIVIAGTSGCTKEESPAKQALPESLVKVEVAVPSVTEAVASKGVASAVQSSTQTLIHEENSITGGVTSDAQASTQDALRGKDAIVGGVASAAQASTQDALREGDAIAGGVASAAQSSTETALLKEGASAE